ncbi:S66 family peptidase [Alteromonas flava]|uniref:S66 family peptidase n=1 Tax=Alteromonas flava TaxID=2048003 RepID=UPI000C28CC2A|nr:S66 peptidase family protein [Alteromonas flava]
MTLYPRPLREGSTIAITAVSSGLTSAHKARFENVLNYLTQRGYQVKVGECLWVEQNGVSASAHARARELMNFLLDDSIDVIAPPWGGELAIELLPLLDYDALAQGRPKWFMGFSDISTLAVVLHAKLGWSTVHCANLMDLVASNTDPLLVQTLDCLHTAAGECFTQYSSLHHTRDWPAITEDSAATIKPSLETRWRWLDPSEKHHTIEGRLIGGCWDTLQHLFNTEFLALKELRERSKEPLILFLENAEMTPFQLSRVLMAMQFRGVFEAIDALLVGRHYPTISAESSYDFDTFLRQQLARYSIPTIVDMDIGHAPPNLTLVNGARCQIQLSNGKGKITQWLD